jgi:hypothetical protein
VGGDAAHTLGGIESLGLYLPVLLLGMIPWSLWAPKALLKRAEMDEVGSFLATCSVAVFVFFTVGGAKLPHYILPVLPPLAILVAYRLKDRSWAFPLGIAWCLVVAVSVNLIQSWYYEASRQAEAHALARYIRGNADGKEVALFQIGRREKDLGTGTLKIRETSLPSMMLYLDRVTLDTDDFDKILAAKNPTWIFTRNGRIQPEHYARALKAGEELRQVHPSGIDRQSYEVFLLVKPD